MNRIVPVTSFAFAPHQKPLVKRKFEVLVPYTYDSSFITEPTRLTTTVDLPGLNYAQFRHAEITFTRDNKLVITELSPFFWWITEPY